MAMPLGEVRERGGFQKDAADPKHCDKKQALRAWSSMPGETVGFRNIEIFKW